MSNENKIIDQKINDLCLLRDERDILAKKLKESDEKYRNLFENYSDGIYIYDEHSNIIDANEKILLMLGYSKEEFLKLNLSEIYENYEKENKYVTSKFETYLKNKNGNSISVEISKNSFENENITFFREFVRDITIRKSIELSLHSAKQKAEESTKAKSMFLSTMSHEIRTPMNGVLGMSQLLLETKLTSEQLDIVKTIQKSGEILLSIINNILDFSKIEADKIDLENNPFNIIRMIEDVFEVFYTISKTKNIQLLYVIDEKIPSWVSGDITRLKQILMNLVNNALKFTEEGQITVSVNLIEKRGNFIDIYFSIKDTGIGIHEEKIKTLFKPFNQSDPSITRNYGGTGLGLSISAKLVSLMGGKISVISSSKGSEFLFNVTLESDNNSTKVYTGSKLNSNFIEKDLFEKIPLSILVAEDNDLNRKLILKVLKVMGYSVDTAINGLEVVNKVMDTHYDIIFMDVQMPEMDGITATKDIIDLNLTKPIIIAVTANSTKEDRDFCLASGMDDYISKPISIVDIQNLIKKWGNVITPLA